MRGFTAGRQAAILSYVLGYCHMLEQPSQAPLLMGALVLKQVQLLHCRQHASPVSTSEHCRHEVAADPGTA